MSMQEFFNMGGYAFYVWSSYGLCAFVLILNLIQSLFRQRKTLNDLSRRQRQRKARNSK